MTNETGTEYVCPECGDTFTIDVGRLYAIPEGVDSAIQCRACYLKTRKVMMVPKAPEVTGTEQVLNEMNRMGINVRLHGHLTLGIMQDGPAKEAASAFIADIIAGGNFGRLHGLYIWGDTGTGKSQLAVAIVRQLLVRRILSERGVVYDRARAMVTQLQDRYTHGNVDEFSERRRRAGLWIYEDAGTEKLTPDAFRIVEELLDAREGHATIITSNLNRGHLASRWTETGTQSERFRSRLSLFHPVHLTGKDKRFERLDGEV
jgi:chromosomal replication initiation ATPase DnaA